MIFTGIFLFLLGTNLGHAAPKTEVKYEDPIQITVNEQKVESIELPALESPPPAPTFFHRGSNYFFNPHIFMSPGFIRSGIEKLIAPFQPIKEITISETEDPKFEKITDKVEIEELIQTVPEVQIEIDRIPIELPEIAIPQIEIEESIQTIPNIPQVQIEIDRIPIELSSIAIPQIESEESNQTIPQVHIEIDRAPTELTIPELPVQVLCEEPIVDLQIENVIPNVPMLIEEPVQPTGGFFISEVDVQLNKLPPAPELPPLIESELPKPVIAQENKKVVLIASTPELPPFIMSELPTPVIVQENKKVVPIPPAPVLTPFIMSELPTPLIALENKKVVPVPPAPVLPPFNMSELPTPVIAQENKKVVLIPSAPELTMVHPPSVMVENSLFSTDYAQNIVFERILPYLAFEHGKTVELISIPATKRAPVVSAIIL